MRRFNTKQFIHKDIRDFLKALKAKDVLLSFDLDLFNKSDYFQEGDIWKENEIIKFVEDCTPLINNSVLITIAMSFDYSGTADDTRYLVKLVVPMIIKIFREGKHRQLQNQ